MRTILHSDCNNFYASVECAFDPTLRGKPVAVCGDPGERHGIVLAKSDAAKKCGIRTGETVWSARQKCPELILLPPCGEKYVRFSRMMRKIYAEYSNQVEAFGLDESWLDVSGSALDGQEIASRLRRRAREELGITLSIGISFNKVFAKLGSDLHKPDATTIISEQNYRQKIWPLPADNLLFIGRQTAHKLHAYGLHTIGDVAQASPATLHALLGQNGDMLYAYASGQDSAPVLPLYEDSSVKSIGNSTTPAFDIAGTADARRILYQLADSVAERMRQDGLCSSLVTLSLRDTTLHTRTHQTVLRTPTMLSSAIAQAAFALLMQVWDPNVPLRSLGIQCGGLRPLHASAQLSLLQSPAAARQIRLEKTIDQLRARFGHNALQRGAALPAKPLDPAAEGLSAAGLAAANMAAIHGRGL